MGEKLAVRFNAQIGGKTYRNGVSPDTPEQPIEVEVRSLAELEDALSFGAEAILLDNMTPQDVRAAVERCSKADRRIPLESSGGVNLENVRPDAETGGDFSSVGPLTHSAPAVDLSLRIAPV